MKEVKLRKALQSTGTLWVKVRHTNREVTRLLHGTHSVPVISVEFMVSSWPFKVSMTLTVEFEPIYLFIAYSLQLRKELHVEGFVK